MKKLFLADGLIWVLLGIVICVLSLRLRFGNFHTPGAGFLPFFSGLLLGIFGLVLMVSSYSASSKVEGDRSDRKVPGGPSLRVRLNPLLTIVILFGYILLLDDLGFLLTTFVFLLFLFKLSEPRKWLFPLVLSGGTAVLSYFLFSVWLQCQLPKGMLTMW